MAHIPTPRGAIRLGSPVTIEEFAKVMYQSLRTGDQMKLDQIIVNLPPGDGLAEAIRDRLYKAANK
jgi:L-threonylcarbamoyladenylate synthase